VQASLDMLRQRLSTGVGVTLQAQAPTIRRFGIGPNSNKSGGSAKFVRP